VEGRVLVLKIVGESFLKVPAVQKVSDTLKRRWRFAVKITEAELCEEMLPFTADRTSRGNALHTTQRGGI